MAPQGCSTPRLCLCDNVRVRSYPRAYMPYWSYWGFYGLSDISYMQSPFVSPIWPRASSPAPLGFSPAK